MFRYFSLTLIYSKGYKYMNYQKETYKFFSKLKMGHRKNNFLQFIQSVLTVNHDLVNILTILWLASHCHMNVQE